MPKDDGGDVNWNNLFGKQSDYTYHDVFILLYSLILSGGHYPISSNILQNQTSNVCMAFYYVNILQFFIVSTFVNC